MDYKEQAYTRYEHLREFCRTSWDEPTIRKLDEAFRFASSVIGSKQFKTGEYIFNHSLDVATIIAIEIGLGPDSVITGMLHNIMYAGLERKVTREEFESHFGQPVYSILEGMAKINALGTDTVELHPENYRKLLMALAGDVRVILVKTADRLQVMRNLDIYEESTQQRLVNETSHLYAPLAHRLGLYVINSEFQDLCLKYQNFKGYQYVVDRLKETKNERENFVAEFVKPVEKTLKERGFQFSMKARTKSIFSIWNKMQKKKVSFDEVMDLFAIRIILDSKPENEKTDCWTVYSIVTEQYQANPERMRDWITIPKSNGYESLHATVMGPQGRWVEVQIRTRRMDEVAEKGLAAHWKYKDGKGGSEFDKWLAGIREVLENPDVNVVDFIDQFSLDIYKDETFVFTPRGDLRKMPSGATLLDFAYEIHSDLGDKCVGGMVNGRKVTLRYKLKNGDQVTIETSNNQKPKIDWLDFLITSKAKNRVRASLSEEKKKLAAQGREILIRKFKNWKLELNDEAIRKILKKYELKLAMDFYCELANGKIEPLEVKSLFTEKAEEESTRRKMEELLPPGELRDFTFDGGDDYLIIANHLKNINYKLARCCNPVFGDPIFGFVTIRDGIKIHRQSCPNAPQMKERFPYRIIKAKWQETTSTGAFLTTIHISGTDEAGIVSEVSHIIAKDTGARLRSINIDSRKGKFEGVLKISVYNTNHLEFLLHRMKKIKGVISVTRGET
ncbi:bifunctional (p)ppGpp synthetase/guanosine-3',5'-bis(diphosphate) 3'-pyrophosphohydrolase [Mariniphaga sediminis]|uniref:Bifunctional (P)ppGpp synthetase/guanosine-3',5'-bis(Diphosphate) 3'-pyrophosphohydrolase n=1 Tax=Mariniphaga sediminis TaxID=1628158 RepID=A0A399CXE7_9BACT|nr:RelA/SpoT family protein [Mariniphaga sediminis]RIH64344.1 bifunctional (p)ppGpp synthetase/guanosine-3',5'-bis(diphosphate) 3'-pyrophosphohydrolase [Mariniphaga sediminis]